ncbi:OsmC family protein [Agromyces subbeticus]|uniref:OsmC family protein n=1 Tax=Agromyces subbeticus TaxID=293890 RepID=UPI00040E7A70|nr:OsmC family protein [Agromyces subbeticus]
MTTTHHYDLGLHWTGNLGTGTATYRGYGRDHEVTADGLPPIPGSSDLSFRGDPARWNPEQLLVASIAQCHMLWYLHLAAGAGVVVTDYADTPTGAMLEEPNGSGQFSEVTLRPRVTIDANSDPHLAEELHERVGDYCFIARSVNFAVLHEPTTLTA